MTDDSGYNLTFRTSGGSLARVAEKYGLPHDIRENRIVGREVGRVFTRGRFARDTTRYNRRCPTKIRDERRAGVTYGLHTAGDKVSSR